jgi:hypothetical protein
MWKGVLIAEGGAMLRVEMHNAVHVVVMRLEGRCVGEYAEYCRSLAARLDPAMSFLVDLTEVSFVDSVGEGVLSSFGHMGAEFIAENSYPLDVCERLHLLVRRPHARPKASSSAKHFRS